MTAVKRDTMENDIGITRREELNDRETEEIASVLAGARPSNRINVDRKELRDRLNHILTETGLLHSSEGDDEDQIFEEAFTEFASEPERARELRDQYRELAVLFDCLEQKLKRHDLAPALAARLRWLRASQPHGARNSTDLRDKITEIQILYDIRNVLPLLKQAAEDLSIFKTSQITTGRPRDEFLDVLMAELAEVYLAFRPEKDRIADLSASPRSIFLRFCSDVLQYFFSSKATDPGTLSHRWRRLRKSLRNPS